MSQSTSHRPQLIRSSVPVRRGPLHGQLPSIGHLPCPSCCGSPHSTETPHCRPFSSADTSTLAKIIVAPLRLSPLRFRWSVIFSLRTTLFHAPDHGVASS